MSSLRRAAHSLLRRRGYHSCYNTRALNTPGAESVTSNNVLLGDGIDSCKAARWTICRYLYKKDFTGSRNLDAGRCGFCTITETSNEIDGSEDEVYGINEEKEETVEMFPDKLDLSRSEMGRGCEKTGRESLNVELLNVIMAATGPRRFVNIALDKWVKKGNVLGRDVVDGIVTDLRKLRSFGRALQFYEWLETTKLLEYTEGDYANCLDFVHRVRGLEKSVKYFECIPPSFKGEAVYRTQLANFISCVDVKKAEQMFQKMKSLFPLDVVVCNQMITLYKRVDKTKIADVLMLMQKENINKSLSTYHLLIDTKGESNDIVGMEQLVEKMRAEGIHPEMQTKSILTKYYVHWGFEDKAMSALKEIESEYPEGNQRPHQSLLLLYASLQKADEVARIWETCKLTPSMDEYAAAIEAWGKLGNIEEAEAVLEEMLKRWKKISSRHYSSLLRVYVDHKLLDKGAELMKRMGDSGCWIGPLAWDTMVKLFLEAGEVEKAKSVLQKAVKGSRMRPLFHSYIIIMEEYSKRGDVHNTEKMFHRMRQSGYIGCLKPYELLIKAYINANAPAYGFRERMKAENVFPNRLVVAQLAQADAFKQAHTNYSADQTK